MPHASLPHFLQLFTLTDATATERLTARLALVLHDPAAYQAQYAEEFSISSRTELMEPQYLRDQALSEGLLNEELLANCDWKESAAEMAEHLNDVLTRQGRHEQLAVEPESDDYEVGVEQLDMVIEALEPLGLVLVEFDSGSDSYWMTVVAQEHAGLLRELADKLGFQLSLSSEIKYGTE